MELKNPAFMTTAVDEKGYPHHHLPEVALAGRSNVGKSSLLNHLFQRKKLVKTSSTPGKTQAIQFFSTDHIAFVDLPGYGFANVPVSVRKHWGPMVQGYLENRDQLKGLLLLFDIRRKPNEEDLQMLDWARFNEIPLVLVLTKVDKVNQSEKRKQTQKILQAFDDDTITYVHYSVTKNIGRKELLSKIKEVVG